MLVKKYKHFLLVIIRVVVLLVIVSMGGGMLVEKVKHFLLVINRVVILLVIVAMGGGLCATPLYCNNNKRKFDENILRVLNSLNSKQ